MRLGVLEVGLLHTAIQGSIIFYLLDQPFIKSWRERKKILYREFVEGFKDQNWKCPKVVILAQPTRNFIQQSAKEEEVDSDIGEQFFPKHVTILCYKKNWNGTSTLVAQAYNKENLWFSPWPELVEIKNRKLRRLPINLTLFHLALFFNVNHQNIKYTYSIYV